MSKKRISSGNKSDSTLKDDNTEDPVEIEKQELRNQIKKLKSLISQVEESLDITKFGDIEKSSETLLSQTVDYRASKKLIDTNVLFRKEIIRYIGIYCSKATKTEYVFHYKPDDRTGENENFSLQILNKNGKGTVGHWVAPMLSIDIEKILAETPIDDLSMVIPFLKNWKRYIDCYVQRKKQFQELKNFISDASNCTVEKNLSFSGITISLFGVLNTSKDSYFSLTIYLAYKSNETRPYKVNPVWSLKKCPPKDENELKAYVKCLKNHSLIEGFKLMIEGKNTKFWWAIEEHDDSPLELNNTSDSDEESFMDRIKSNRRKSLRKLRKRRESKERSKRMNERKRAAASRSEVVVGNETEDSSNKALSSPQETKKPAKSSARLRKRSEPENTIEELVAKRQRVLRQTTISFRDNRISTNYSEIAKDPEIPDDNDKKSVKPKNPKPVTKTKQKSTPVKKITTPVKKITTPVKKVTTPKKKITSPAKKITSPVKKVTTPVKKMKAPVRKVTNPVKKITTPVEKMKAPVRKVTNPVKKITTPVRKMTTPVKKITTPVRKISTPVKKITTPVKKITTPVKKNTSPLKKTKSPIRKIRSPSGILSAKKKVTQKINRAVTSTPLAKKIASRVKFRPMNDVELSPITSAVENDNES